MTETSQKDPSLPAGVRGEIIPRDTSRFSKLSSEPPAVIPPGTKGVLEVRTSYQTAVEGPEAEAWFNTDEYKENAHRL
jgi:hypothetical protein